MLSQDTPAIAAYVKRFRMEIDLVGPLPPVPALPPGYSWLAWRDELLDLHAQTKFACFAEELDGQIFPSLGTLDGCVRLMREIAGRAGFRPEATWLIQQGQAVCGTVQGVRDRFGMGGIQNLGVVAEHRGLGLGKALLLQALHGFQRTDCHRAHLEVTARNDLAVRLYHQLGFRRRKTLYKPIDPPANFLDQIVW